MSYTDEAQAAPAEKPEGAPDLTPLLKLPFDKRADVLEALADITDAQAKADAEFPDAEGDKEDQGVSVRRAAALFRLMGKLEGMLRQVAVDAESFDAWREHSNDNDLSQLAGYYMRTFQVGEASASPAS